MVAPNDFEIFDFNVANASAGGPNVTLEVKVRFGSAYPPVDMTVIAAVRNNFTGTTTQLPILPPTVFKAKATQTLPKTILVPFPAGSAVGNTCVAFISIICDVSDPSVPPDVSSSEINFTVMP